MAREDLHFRLRIPEGLKRQIEANAKANNRSMTGEIIARLSGVNDETLRDKFAGLALQALLSNAEDGADSCSEEDVDAYYVSVSVAAYEIANAMLAARKAGA